jgi:hypothetical protein
MEGEADPATVVRSEPGSDLREPNVPAPYSRRVHGRRAFAFDGVIVRRRLDRRLWPAKLGVAGSHPFARGAVSVDGHCRCARESEREEQQEAEKNSTEHGPGGASAVMEM